VHADEAAGWNILHASYPMKPVNHSVEYKSDDDVCDKGPDPDSDPATWTDFVRRINLMTWRERAKSRKSGVGAHRDGC
jgi:hypothetical protein